MIFSWKNLIDSSDATVDAGTPETNSVFSAENMQSKNIETPWRVADLGGGFVDARFPMTGETEDVQCIAMLGALVSGTDTNLQIYRMEGYSQDPRILNVSHTLDLELSAILPNFEDVKMNLFRFFPAQSGPGAGALVAAEVNSGGHADVGRAWAGPVWQLDHGVFSYTLKDTGASNRSRRNYGYPAYGQTYRQVLITIPAVTDDEVWNSTAENFFDAVREIASGDEVIVCPIDDDTSNGIDQDNFNVQRLTVYGTLSAKSDITNRAGKFMGMKFLIEEIM